MHCWKLVFALIQRFTEPCPRARCYVLCFSPAGAPGTKGYGAYTLVRKTDKKVFFFKVSYIMYQRMVLCGKESMVRKNRSVEGGAVGKEVAMVNRMGRQTSGDV